MIMEQEDILNKIPEEVLSRIPSQFKNPWVQAASVAVVSLVSGGIGGYFFGRRRMRKAWAEDVVVTTTVTTETVVEDPDDVGYFTKVPDAVDPNWKDHPVMGTMTTLHIVPGTEDDAPMITIPDSTSADGDWDFEIELQNRHQNAPYIIHQEEYLNDEFGYRQETVTYYAGDNIVSDVQDKPVYNYPLRMGELRFGHGTNSPDVVYIRNEKEHMEWEVIRNEGMFAVEVMGLEADMVADRELRHSNVPKFRRE